MKNPITGRKIEVTQTYEDLLDERAAHARTRKALREAVFGLRYIEDGAECESIDLGHEDGPMECEELASKTPCAPCAARRALKRVAAARRGKR